MIRAFLIGIVDGLTETIGRGWEDRRDNAYDRGANVGERLRHAGRKVVDR